MKKIIFGLVVTIIAITSIASMYMIQSNLIITEEDRIRMTIEEFFNARRQNSLDDYLAFFTDDGDYIDRYQNCPPISVRWNPQQFYAANASSWNPPSDLTVKGFNIAELQISNDQAFVTCIYIRQSNTLDFLGAYMEKIELVKINDEWKIQKDYLVYMTPPEPWSISP